MRVLVVVLNWNGADDTVACLDALERQTHPDFDVFVVDNGSRAADLKTLRGRVRGPRIRLHEEPENLGFAGGVNIGIRRAIAEDYDAVALLNNDALADPEWLAGLAAASERTGAAVATGLMLRRSADPGRDGTIDSAGDLLSVWGMPFPRGRGHPASHAPPAGPVLAASGGASLYRTALFAQIGLFDEHFFAYFEDVDVSLRARLAGHTVTYEPAAVVHHRIGGTSGRVPGLTVFHTFKNLPVLLIKNIPTGVRHRVYPRFAALYALMLAKAIVTGSGRHAVRGALASVRLQLGDARRERSRIQSARVRPAGDFSGLLWPDLPPEQRGMRRLISPFRALRRRRVPARRG